MICVYAFGLKGWSRAHASARLGPEAHQGPSARHGRRVGIHRRPGCGRHVHRVVVAHDVRQEQCGRCSDARADPGSGCRRCVRHVQARETRASAHERPLEVFLGRLQLRLPVENQAPINASTASPKNNSACFGWLIVKYTMATTTNTTAAAIATIVSGRTRKGTLVSGIAAP